MTLVVNGEKIEDSVIQKEVERLRPDYEKAFKDQDPEEQEAQLLNWSRENVIEKILLKQEAGKRGDLVSDDEVESALVRLKAQYDSEEEFHKEFGTDSDETVRASVELTMKLDRILKDACKDVPEPSKKAVLEYYEEHKEQFEFPEQVRAAHIVKHIDWQTDETAAHELIRQAHDELKSGVLFEMLVEKYSDCPENGGSLGYIMRGEMVEEFDDVVFNLGINEVSDIFRTRFGFHLAKVYDRKSAAIPPLEEVRDRLRREVREQMRNKAIEDFIDGLKSKAKIEEV